MNKKLNIVLVGLALLGIWFFSQLIEAKYNTRGENFVQGVCQRSDEGTKFEFRGTIDWRMREISILDQLPRNKIAWCSVRSETIIPWDIETVMKGHRLYIAYTPFTLVKP